MHARHRSPGNGYRSNSMGMAVASSRISPEGSIRGHGHGHGMYNSDYRNFNRSFGRGHPKSYQPPQPPPRRGGDIFMEAGRLAAEYLVSKGLLPPSSLPSKWQNASFKKPVGDFQEFRPQEGEDLQLPPEGRTSALARLGNVVPDAGSARRRISDDYNPTGSRNPMRGRRRIGSFRNYGSDWGRENGRSGSWSDKARTSPDTEGDEDSVSEHHEEQQGGKDGGGGGVQNLHPSELAPKSDDAGNSKSELEKHQTADDMGPKATSSGSEKDLPLETEGELTKESDDLGSFDTGTGEVKDGASNDETGKQSATEGSPIQHGAMECDPGGQNFTDLLRFCKFAKVPTKTRSSLRGLKAEVAPVTEEGNTSDMGPPTGSGVPLEDDTAGGFSGDALSNLSHTSKCIDSDSSKAPSVQSVEEVGELSLAYAVEQGKCMRSQSFPDRAFMYEQASSQGPPGYGRCSSMGSMVKERGEKRSVQHSDIGEGSKKPREWLPHMLTQDDGYFHLAKLSEKEPSSQEERASPGERVIVAIDQKSSGDISLFPKGGDEPCIEYVEEKPLLSSSFKICDLNLMEASDVNENHDGDPIFIYPSISESKKEAAPVDIDLSISNKCNISNEYGRHAADGKEVEVIDLENDSAEEDKPLNNSERKTETVYSGLESFPNHAQNTSDIPDGQDGYGLMISELLGADISNCPSIPADINSLHNEMGLHNGEGILGEDDSIYMSLGEIPISYLRAWEQPAQEYEKPF
ncbi:hypothetical protein L1049_001288 [Liquidambar formosana]|uniref:Uncharacterized protein n=1 Tax=Liquidambar formosana TaxID=63359 RepID=A0AAP0NB86_LIQFO